MSATAAALNRPTSNNSHSGLTPNQQTNQANHQSKTTAAADNTSTSNQAGQASTPSPGNRSVDFALSTNSVTIYSGETTPSITAHTNDGQPVAWAVFAPAQSNMLVTSGMTNGSSVEASHSFTIGGSVNVKPGTYTATIRGYLPHGPQVEKTIAINVLARVTFKLLPFPSEGTNPLSDQGSQSCTPFQVQWLVSGSKPNLTVSAHVVSSPNNVQVVYTSLNPDAGGGCISLSNQSAPGTLVVQLSASDGSYSTSINMTYQVFAD